MDSNISMGREIFFRSSLSGEVDGEAELQTDRVLAATLNHREAERRRRERIKLHLDRLRSILSCDSKVLSLSVRPQSSSFLLLYYVVHSIPVSIMENLSVPLSISRSSLSSADVSVPFFIVSSSLCSSSSS